MQFFAVSNLTEQSMAPSVPWEFVLTETLTQQIRHDKESRQNWYRNVATRHNFYSAIEASNPGARPSKDNPPRLLHGFVLDYDLPLDEARILAAIASMKRKPAYWERSLAGNARLVWMLPEPLRIETMEFAVFVMQRALKWLQAELLPGLDEGAATDPNRLYCNGCEWHPTGHGPVPLVESQSFFVACGQDYNFKPSTSVGDIPLDIVEKGLREKYPNFAWPGNFEEEAQGPSFWVEGSQSTMSALVKKDGMFTFSAHAEKPFYSWIDLLGREFCEGFIKSSVAEATRDCFYDGRMFWRKFPNGDQFAAESREDFTAHLRVDLQISAKPDKSGSSLLDRCTAHIRNFCRVEGGAPFIFSPPGAIEFNGKRFVNIFKPALIKPSETLGVWGEAGNFPFLSRVLDNIFDPSEQKEPFLAWFRHFYTSGLVGKPLPGQNVFIAGGPGIGKTFLNRIVLARAMGGFTDARDYIMGEDSFGADVYSFPMWCVDDETIADNEAAHRRFTSMIKKAAANQSFRYHKKFEQPLIIPWMGRILVTLNLDETSSRTLPALDGSILEKVSFFRGAAEAKIKFPERYELDKIVDRELPIFLRWLVDSPTPPQFLGDSRYGIRAHHEATLLDKAHQASQSAPFKEIMVDWLVRWFDENKKATEWRGSVTQIMKTLANDPYNESVIRGLKISQINRYLESLAREGVLSCQSENGDHKIRVWVFSRIETPVKKMSPSPK